MSEPFLAEVKIFGFNFPPRGWAMCNGQLLPINQNQSLFSLLGTTYGGNGRTDFALPELRGRTPIHVGQATGATHKLGERAGAETHVLTTAEIPAHAHTMRAINVTGEESDSDGHLTATAEANTYRPKAADTTFVNMESPMIANNNGGQGHNNLQPYLALNFCIATQGLFPSRN